MKLACGLKRGLIFLSITLLFLIVAFYSVQKVTDPGFCQLCHEILPEYKTWLVSSHSKISCNECHWEYNPKKNIHAIPLIFNEITLHLIDRYNKPIQMRKLMNIQVCVNCHKGKVAHKSTYKFSHLKHETEKINCVVCHAGVAHGRIAERGQTRTGKYESLETVPWEKEMITENIKPSMNGCLKCHQTGSKPIDCQLCHEKINKPKSHMKEDWVNNHSKEAFDQINSCEKCHINQLLITDESRVLSIDMYTKTTDFCAGCHLKKPVSHTTDWTKEHGKKAVLSRISCLVCHREKKGQIAPQEKVVQVSCSDCH